MSEGAVRVAVALHQRPDGMRLAELARALGIRASSAQRALQTLGRSGFVERLGAGYPQWRLRWDHPAVRQLVSFAHRTLPIEIALDALFRSNRAVELAVRDQRGYLVVLRRLTDPADDSRLRRSIFEICDGRLDAPDVELHDAGEVRDPAGGDPRLRRRALAADAVVGSVDRSIPDRSHRRPTARALRRLHPIIRVPSRRWITALARRYRLNKITIFGSAVRDDFRPGSDLDVLIEPELSAELGLDDLIKIREAFEEVFERDVDVVNARYARQGVRMRASEEGVPLHG